MEGTMVYFRCGVVVLAEAATLTKNVRVGIAVGLVLWVGTIPLEPTDVDVE